MELVLFSVWAWFTLRGKAKCENDQKLLWKSLYFYWSYFYMA